jgi:threonine dehydrogenase-like Zn-dependent dehydrogenase
MRALRMSDAGPRLEEAPEPTRDGEALIRVRLSGICNTDLEIVRGYAGFRGTLGHEFVGEVLAAPGRPEMVGRRVVGEINAGCGACALCRGGDPRHCAGRTVLGIVGRDGAHAERLALPVENLLLVPETVSDEEAVFAEPLAAAFGILERTPVEAGTRVAVIGDGKLGLLCAQAVATVGAEVVAIGRHAEKLALLARRGIGVRLADATADLARDFDVVIEASGAESGFRRALTLVRPRGVIVLKSTFHGEPPLAAWPIVVDEIAVVGSRCGRFAPALEALARGAVDVLGLVQEELPLAAGVAALAKAGAKGARKILLRP